MNSLIDYVEPIGWQFESCFLNVNVPIISYKFKYADKCKQDLVELVDSIETFYLKNKPDSINSSDGDTSTQSINTHNFMNYNIFDFDEYDSVKSLQQFVEECILHYKEEILKLKSKDTFIQCWGNKVDRLDYLSYHYHNNIADQSSLSANYFLKCSGTETFTEYEAPSNVFTDNKNIYINNIEGELTIFPSFIKHRTSPVRNKLGIRYSLGMDIVENNYNDLKIHGCWKKIV
jgi:hypothetical protein